MVVPTKLREGFMYNMSRKRDKERSGNHLATPNFSLMGPVITGKRTNATAIDVLGSPSTLIGLRDRPGGLAGSRLSTKSEFDQKTVSDNRFMIRNSRQPYLAKSSTGAKEENLIPRLRYFNNFV